MLNDLRDIEADREGAVGVDRQAQRGLAAAAVPVEMVLDVALG